MVYKSWRTERTSSRIKGINNKMKDLILITIWQIFLLLFLIKKDKNSGEKELFKNQHWKAFDVVITVLFIDALKFIFYYLSKIDSMHLLLRNNFYLFHLILFIFVIGLFKFKFKQSLKVLGFKKNDFKKSMGIGIVVALISYLIYHILYLSIGPSSYTLNVIEKLRTMNFSFYFMQYIITGIILVPVVEESISRGISYSPYRKKYGSKVAIILTSLLFASFHFEIGFISFFIIGILLGILYEKTESMVSPIVAHSVYSLLGILAMAYVL